MRSDLDSETTAAVLFEMGWGVVRAGCEDATGMLLDAALATLNDIVGRHNHRPGQQGTVAQPT